MNKVMELLMKRFEVLVCLLFLLGPKTQAAAQVNIEKLRAKPAASGFSSSVQLDLSTRSGNVDIHQFGIRTRTRRRGSIRSG